MTVIFQSNLREIAVKKPLEINLAMRFALLDIERTARPKTPMDTGELRDNTRGTVQGTTMRFEWLAEHAQFQERKQYTNYTTPGTGPHFAEETLDEVNGRFDQHLRNAKAIE